MKFQRAMLWPMLVVFAVLALTAWASKSPEPLKLQSISDAQERSVDETVAKIDAVMTAKWRANGLAPAFPADELTLYRRLSLALLGTIPSLEELRRFEEDLRPDRLRHWTETLLEDPRCADYLAERLARAYVGIEMGQILLFRRDRFTTWLAEQLHKNRPYDQIVHSMIAADGMGTGEPEVNFVIGALANDAFDQNKLAGRTVRAFLGQRIDCAQCHDHPFAHWKQGEFEGLAACYGQVSKNLVGGILDNPKSKYEVLDRKTTEMREVQPVVPFGKEWMPELGKLRERLATWVVHPENQRFERAIANRMWGLLFGRPYLAGRPVDDLPDPDDAATKEDTRVLDLLGADFRTHGCDLRRLISVITATKAFRMESRSASAVQALVAGTSESSEAHEGGRSQETEGESAAEREWAVFPLIRLRPEQVIGAMLQAWSIQKIDQNSQVFIRLFRFFRENDFVREYGDPGENELGERGGTIPQALLRMNGEFAEDLTKPSPVSSAARIMNSASTREKFLETCYLVCLTRRPTAVEAAHFLARIPDQSRDRKEIVQDIFWSLFNSPEFSWNH